MIRAKIRSLRDGHSERSLIHAVDGDGLEYKLEVPTEALASVSRARDLTLIMSWVVEETPAAGAAEVDASFAEIMRGSTTGPSPESAALLSELTNSVSGTGAAGAPGLEALLTKSTPGASARSNQPAGASRDTTAAERQLANLLGIPH